MSRGFPQNTGRMLKSKDIDAVSIFVVELVELTNTVFVISTDNVSPNIETAVLSRNPM